MAKKLSLMEDKKKEEEKKKQGSVTATPSSTTKQNKVVSNAEKKQAKANAQDAKFGTNTAITEAKDTTSKKAANENYRRANGDYTDTYKAQTATKNGTKNFSDIKKTDYANAVPTLTDRLSDLRAVKPSQSTRTDGFISGITKRETPLTQEIPVLSGELKDIPKQQTSWANLEGDDFINWYESSDNVSEKQKYQTKYEQLKAQQIYQKAKSLGLDADEYIRKYPSYLTQLGSAGFSKDKLAEKDAQFRADYLAENGTYPDDSMLPSSNRGTYGDLISDFKLQTQLKKKSDEVGLSKDEFKDLLSYYVQPIEAQKAQEQYKSVANDNKLGGTLLSFANNIIGSVENIGDKAGSYLKSEPMRTNSYGAIDANTAQEMRNEVSKDWGNTGQFLYGAGTSLGDMALAMALGNAAGGSSAAASAITRGLMAGEKASQTMNEAVDRGLDPNQVIGEGLTSAVTTYVTEKIPMGTWESVARNGITGATSKEIAKNVAKKLMASAATEGIQEGTEDLADAIADRLIAGDKSALNQEIASYIAQGYSQAEATKMAYTNFATTVGLDSLAGALSGGAMGTISLPGNIRLTPNTETQNNAPVATQTNAQAENLIPSLEEAIRQYDAQNNQNAELDNRVMARANQNYENALSNPLNEAVQSSLGDMSIEDAQWVLDNLRANPNTDAGVIANLQSEIDNAIQNQSANNMRDRVVFEGEFISTEEAQNLLNQFEQTRNDLVSLNADTEYVDSAITSLSEQLNAVDERNRTRNRDILFPTNENTNEQVNVPTVESSNEQGNIPTAEVMNEQTVETPATANTQNGLNLQMVTDTPVPVMSNEEASVNNPKNILSQTSWNTFENSDTFTQNEENMKWLKSEQESGDHNVDSISERESVEKAASNLDKDFNGEVVRIKNRDTITGVDQDESMMIIDAYLKSGQYGLASEFMQSMVQKTHNAAQGLQALAKYTRTASSAMMKTNQMIDNATKDFESKNKKASGENKRLADAIRAVTSDENANADVPAVTKTHEQIREEVVNTLNKKGITDFTDAEIDFLTTRIENGATTSDIAKLLDRRMATGNMEISEEDMAMVTDLYRQARERDPNSKESIKLQKQANAILAKYLPNSTLLERWNSWRYLAMLGNPRTHIRNVLGNTMFFTTTEIKDMQAALGEALISKINKNIDRTKAILNPIKDQKLMAACWNDFDEHAYGMATEGGNKYNERDAIRQEKRMFKSKIEYANKANSTALDWEDTKAIQIKYRRAMAGFLKANGANENIFNSTEPADIELLQRAREYAVNEAKIATFHEDNAFANTLNEWSQSARRNGTVGSKALSYAVEALMPFKKTPANILKQGVVEYNPVVQIPKALLQIKNGNATEAINSIAKGMTGAEILALGAWLASKGILHAKKDETDDISGVEEYSINIGNGSYTLDWAAPTALPLFVGAELFNEMVDNDGFTTQEFWNALSSISEPVVEMSMLQGFNDTLDAIAMAKYDTEKGTLSTLVTNLGLGYLSQGIPTIGGQWARAIDPTRRSTYTGKTGIADTVMRQVKKAENKIPGASYLSEPYVNKFGEEEENTGGNFVGRLLYNSLSPGYYSNTEMNDVEAELTRLGEEHENIIPTSPNKKYDGEQLTPEKYTEISKAKGQYISDNLNALFASDFYNGLDDENKAEITHEVELFSNALANKDVFGYDIEKSTTYKKKYDAWKQNGIQGLIDFYQNKENLKDANVNSSSSFGKELSKMTADEISEVIGITPEETKQSQEALKTTMPTLDMTQVLKANAQNNEFVNAETAIPYLYDTMGLDDAKAGEILYNNGIRSESEVKAFNDMGGYPGVAQYYKTKFYGDHMGDGNGNLKKAEARAYLESLGYSLEEINKWIEIYGWQPYSK